MNSSNEKSNQEKIDELVELVGQTSLLGSKETKKAVSLCQEIGDPACEALAGIMVKDIMTRLDSDNSHTSTNAALVLGKVGKMSIPALSSAVRTSSYAHMALGLVAGSGKDRTAKKQAINILETELMSSDGMRAEAAIKGFGYSKYKKIIPVLKKLQSTTSNYDLIRACDNALANLSPLSQIIDLLIKR